MRNNRKALRKRVNPNRSGKGHPRLMHVQSDEQWKFEPRDTEKKENRFGKQKSGRIDSGIGSF
jgi:hypothetical protein